MARVEVREADITKLEVDAIANAANTQLLPRRRGRGRDRARGRARRSKDESDAKAPIGLGEAVETAAGELPARWVIHAATMELGGPTSAEIIRRATASTLAKADELGARSLALVAFGTGVGGFPLDEAARIEVEEVRRHLGAGTALELVVFAVRGDAAREAFERAFGRVISVMPRPVLVAPDKFKGTLTAHEAALAIGRGLAAGGCRARRAAAARRRRRGHDGGDRAGARRADPRRARDRPARPRGGGRVRAARGWAGRGRRAGAGLRPVAGRRSASAMRSAPPPAGPAS